MLSLHCGLMICIVLIKINGKNKIIFEELLIVLITSCMFLFESLVILYFCFHSLFALWGKDNLSWYSGHFCFLSNASQRCSGHWHRYIGGSCRWWSDETNRRIHSACQRCSPVLCGWLPCIRKEVAFFFKGSASMSYCFYMLLISSSWEFQDYYTCLTGKAQRKLNCFAKDIIY